MIYLIGTSGSGKTTLGNALEQELRRMEYKHLQFIDGDVIRRQFGGIFGYTYEERMRCSQAVNVVIKYLLDNQISVILAQVGAYENMRQKVRDMAGNHYIEVYVKCSYEECARRDVKGYYQRLQKGEMENLNGANDIFEVPESSDIVVETEIETVEESVGKVMGYLKEKGYLEICMESEIRL